VRQHGGRQVGEIVDRQHQRPGEAAVGHLFAVAGVEQHQAAAAVVAALRDPAREVGRRDRRRTAIQRRRAFAAEADDLPLALDLQPRERLRAAAAVLRLDGGEPEVAAQPGQERIDVGALPGKEQVDALGRDQDGAEQAQRFGLRPHALGQGPGVVDGDEVVGGDARVHRGILRNTAPAPLQPGTGVTGSGGRPASGPKPIAAMRLSTASDTIARRVARLALATCGVSTTLRQSSRRGFTAGSPSNTSSPAAASRPPWSASASASSSTRPPRAMLVSVAPGFIRASAAASTMWWLPGVYGSTSTRWSASANSASRPTQVAAQSRSTTPGSRRRLWYSTRMPKP